MKLFGIASNEGTTPFKYSGSLDTIERMYREMSLNMQLSTRLIFADVETGNGEWKGAVQVPQERFTATSVMNGQISIRYFSKLNPPWADPSSAVTNFVVNARNGNFLRMTGVVIHRVSDFVV